MKVLICGLPSSGNCLLQRILREWGVNAEVWHGVGIPKWEDPDAMLVPVRDEAMRLLSCERRCLHFHHSRAECLDGLLHMNPPKAKVIAYEDLVAEPQPVLTDIAEWLGVKYAPPSEDIYDANAKYMEAAQ